MSSELTEETIISGWMAEGMPFAFYRYPGEDVCHGVRAARSSLLRLDTIEALDGQRGFVFAPFHIDGRHPLWLMPVEEEVRFVLSHRPDVVEAPAPVPYCGEPCVTPSADYARVFSRFSSALLSGEFRKLVLSREVSVPLLDVFSWAEAFRVACCRYVRSYVYLFYSPSVGFWLGATPEILLSGGDGAYHTVALAGTQPLADGWLAAGWSDKNQREQCYVTDYICDCLRSHGIEPEVDGPFTVTAGVLAHLKTELRFALPESGRLGSLLAGLHPTPAVCGLPKDGAYRFIRAHEGYARSYYSGFLGRIDPEGTTGLYVNLRCMNACPDSGEVRLYAGGGLLSSSVLEDEWQETERKLQTMKYVIQKANPYVF